MLSLGSIALVGSTFVQYVSFMGDAAFQAAVPGTPDNHFLSAFDLTLRVVQGGTYLICLHADDWGYLDLNGVRLINAWQAEVCQPTALAPGLHAVYAQQAEDLGDSIARVTYQGPDTGNLNVLMPQELQTLPCLWSPRVYPWIGAGQRCRPGQYLAGFDSVNRSQACRPCPEGWVGLNGVFCERCGELEEPYFLDRSSCVCRFPAAMNASGDCACPDGFGQSGRECVPCGLDSYGLAGACRACGAGSYASAVGSTACLPCEFGTYRLAQARGCSSCGLARWFAPDAASDACVPCNASCAMDGWRFDRACPGDGGGYSVCRPCERGLPENATWANWTECAYDCAGGFYRAEGGLCLRCTEDRVCPAGYRLTPCTELADSHCDTACADANKPVIYSHWENGTDCAWACDDGYELRVWDYVMFLLRECARITR